MSDMVTKAEAKRTENHFTSRAGASIGTMLLFGVVALFTGGLVVVSRQDKASPVLAGILLVIGILILLMLVGQR